MPLKWLFAEPGSDRSCRPSAHILPPGLSTHTASRNQSRKTALLGEELDVKAGGEPAAWLVA